MLIELIFDLIMIFIGMFCVKEKYWKEMFFISLE